MPLGPMRTKAEKSAGVRQVMGEWAHGALHSGSKRGPIVHSRKQAIAIALSQTGQSNKRAAGGPTGTPGYAPDPVSEASARAVADHVHNAGVVPVPMRRGGGVRKVYAFGGMSNPPWYAREEAYGEDRSPSGFVHSPVPGRTDQLPISPAAGSYVIPADVVSGLGEGNSLSGARLLDAMFHSGPYGTALPRGGHGGGERMPRPPAVRLPRTDQPQFAYGGVAGFAPGGNVVPIPRNIGDYDDSYSYIAEPLLGGGSSHDYIIPAVKHSILGPNVDLAAGRPANQRAYGGVAPGFARGGFGYPPTASTPGFGPMHGAQVPGGVHAAPAPTGGHGPAGAQGPKAVPIVVAGGEYLVAPNVVKNHPLLGNGDLTHGHRVLDSFVKRVRARTVKTMAKLPGPKR